MGFGFVFFLHRFLLIKDLKYFKNTTYSYNPTPRRLRLRDLENEASLRYPISWGKELHRRKELEILGQACIRDEQNASIIYTRGLCLTEPRARHVTL